MKRYIKSDIEYDEINLMTATSEDLKQFFNNHHLDLYSTDAYKFILSYYRDEKGYKILNGEDTYTITDIFEEYGPDGRYSYNDMVKQYCYLLPEDDFYKIIHNSSYSEEDYVHFLVPEINKYSPFFIEYLDNDDYLIYMDKRLY